MRIRAIAVAVVTLGVVAGCGSTGAEPEAVVVTRSTATPTAAAPSSTATTEQDCRSSGTGIIRNTGCVPPGDGRDEPEPTTTSTPTTTTTSRPPPTTRPPTTTTTEPEGRACEQSFDSQYIPTRSWVTFERNGVQVNIKKHSTLKVLVSSSDGHYDGGYIEPTSSLYEGLDVTTTIGFDWVWDFTEDRFVLKPGQVKAILRVWDCWSYVSGPDDLF